MLLRAYIIRLADGLVASGARFSVVTDITVASCLLFAGAKIGVSGKLDCHGDITVTKIKSGPCTNVTVFVGHSVQVALEIWPVTKFVVPLHRQSSERANVGINERTLE